ncbi:MAG: hypothetical protein L6Q81_15975 [Bacteroidia bacterium]|nr:hypothetical protein [Bacteroidia bacterium]
MGTSRLTSMGRIKQFISKYPALGRVIYFFPVQLVLVQLKKNPALILFWLILTGFVTGKIAAKYGIPLLFVDPEYLGQVGFLSFFIIGFACGGFIMAYQISCYIHNAFRFPFLATVSRPFVKFCMNNMIIPGAFIIVYTWRIIDFLLREPVSGGQILADLSGFYLGGTVFISVSLFYFFKAGKDLSQMFGLKEKSGANKVKRLMMFRDPKLKKLSWRQIHAGKEARDWHVETYFISFFRIRRARPFEHYDKELLNRVFRQNHGRAVIFHVVVIATLLIFGLLRDFRFVMIPAGASIFLLFTLYLMFTGILNTWFRGWTTLVSVILILILNWAAQFSIFGTHTQAYGLDYSKEKVNYTSEHINALANDKAIFTQDSLKTIAMLENWHRRNATPENPKPKLTLMTCSGGGIRSSLWTFYTMRYLDSLTNGAFMKSNALICGSSGGMVGAAYYRELYLRDQNNEDHARFEPSHLENISADLLNPVAFSVAVNDWFLPLRKFEYKGSSYSMNRAFAFEDAMHAATGYVLDKQMKDYRLPEEQAVIPTMILAPTVVNDGRKMIISSQSVSWLISAGNNSAINCNFNADAFEFSRLFQEQKPEELRFSSALRMSATFPYITPLTELPTQPEIEVFDAGMRDNIGTENILRFMYVFSDWINTHTSGVVVVSTRDKKKVRDIPDDGGGNTIFRSLTKPISSFYGNLFGVQDYNHDFEIQLADSWLNVPLDILDFELKNEEPDIIALSWHLTEREKQRTYSCINVANNHANALRYASLQKGSVHQP